MKIFRNTAVWLGALLCIVAQVGNTVQADEESRRYFNALRERRLWSLAELVCLQELKRLPASSPQRIEVALELSEILAAHARDVSDQAEREQLWRQAHETLDAESKQTEFVPHRLVLAVQRASLFGDERAVMTMLAALSPFDERLQKRVIELNSKTILDLTRLEEKIAATRFPPTPPESKGWFDVDSRQLRHTVQFKLAEELLARAMTQPTTSPDRADDFLKGEQLARRVAGGPRDAEISQQATMLLGKLNRLRNAWPRAKGLLDSVDTSVLSLEVRDELFCEQVELLLAQDQFVMAADLLRKAHRDDKSFRHSTLLLVTTVVKLSQTAREHRDLPLANELLAEAERLTHPEVNRVSNYWSQRASLVVTQAQEDVQFGVQVAELIREARGRYGVGDRERAAAAFGQAYQLRLKDGPTDDTFEIGLTHARILVELKQFEAAIKALHALLKEHSTQAARPQADLMRVICLGRVYQSNPTQAGREKFGAALEAHIVTYPDSATQSDAKRMLEQLKAPLKTSSPKPASEPPKTKTQQ